jgi:hypothetical protein
MAENKKIVILAPKRAASNTDDIQKMLKEALGKVGCIGCNSGYDFSIIDIKSRYEVARALESGPKDVFVGGKGGVVKPIDEVITF